MKYNWQDKKVLIVEDNTSNYVLLKSILLLTKIRYTWVESGLTAIEICKNEHFDLIFMDIQLPEFDGYETTAAIREFNKEVPIIVVTAYAFESHKNKAYEYLCNDFIIKPLKSQEIHNVMAKYLEKNS